MQSEIKVGQRFKFNILSDKPSEERTAVVTRVLSDKEEGLGPEVEFYFAYWVEAHELPETEPPTTLVFQRGVDYNVYLEGRHVSITVLE
ncbi:MAG TPA: hypothetical protein VMS18_00750 [Candidatus Binatia bacterium]|nr:hypothetical protein [Candidatus Binatia bacterium]